MFIFLALAMILVNTVLLLATILQLPGNWLMVLIACGLSQWGPEPAMFSLGLLVGIALLNKNQIFLVQTESRLKKKFRPVFKRYRP